MRYALITGWLLVHHYGGTIAWYETKQDCMTVNQWAYDQSYFTAYCIPDRFSVSEIRPTPETKP